MTNMIVTMLKESFQGDHRAMLAGLREAYDLRIVLSGGLRMSTTTQYIRDALFEHRHTHGWGAVFTDIHDALERRQIHRLLMIRQITFPSQVSQSAIWGSIVMSYM